MLILHIVIREDRKSMKLGSHLADWWENVITPKQEEEPVNISDTWLLLYMVQIDATDKRDCATYSDFEVVINNKNIFDADKYKYVFINISTSNIIVLDIAEIIERKYPVKNTIGIRVDEQANKLRILTHLDFDVFNERFLDSKYYSKYCNIHVEQTHNIANIDEKLRGLGYITEVFDSGCTTIKYDIDKCEEIHSLTPIVQTEISRKLIDIIEIQYRDCVQGYKNLNDTDIEYRFINENGKKCREDNAIYFDKNKPTILLRIPDLGYITSLAINNTAIKAKVIYSVPKIGQYIDISKVDTAHITNGSKLFSGVQCEFINIHKTEFKNLTKIRKMFLNCDIDTLDLSGIDLSKFDERELTALFKGGKVRKLRLNLGEHNTNIERTLRIIFDEIKEKPEILYINTPDYKNSELKQFGNRIEHSDNWVCNNSIGGVIQ